jgi:DMSO/TMAO reductase YedYZ molybdopterin-dependent catalytic subunit
MRGMPITPRMFGDRGRRRAVSLGIDPERLPPGQSPTVKWPVLTVGEAPAVTIDEWQLSIDGSVQAPYTLDWAGFEDVAGTEWSGDIHCVTRWSKFGMRWQGASVAELIARAWPTATVTHLLAHSYGGYTTNLPLSDVLEHPALIAHRAEGEPLETDHGGPARLFVPHLYLWKSAKWVTRLQLLDHDQLGFWERNGYHHRGDPWQEERHSVDDYVARATRRQVRRDAR